MASQSYYFLQADDIDNREAQRVWGSVSGRFTAAQWRIISASLRPEVSHLKFSSELWSPAFSKHLAPGFWSTKNSGHKNQSIKDAIKAYFAYHHE